MGSGVSVSLGAKSESLSASAAKNKLTACFQCQADNASESRYCAKCGSGLFEDCRDCRQPVRIGQAFCGNCGFHLLAAFEQQYQTAQSRIDEAKAALGDLAFDQAEDLLRMVQKLGDDQRFSKLRSTAEALLVQLQSQRDQWHCRVTAVAAEAMEAEKKGDHAAVMACTASIPHRLLTDALRRQRTAAEASIEEQRSLRQRLASAVRSKQYLEVGLAVDALLEMQPHDSQLVALASQVSTLLMRSASACCKAGNFADASKQLAAVPQCQQDSPQYCKLKLLVDDAGWITDQIARSEFATPTLSRLANRLVTLAPENERIVKTVKELAERVRTGPEDPQSLYAPWLGPAKGWGGAPLVIPGRTRRIVWGDQEELRQCPTRLSVAIGLALGGLGESSFSGYRGRGRSLGGLIDRLTRKSGASTAWGIDAGASAVRAVRLQRDGGHIKIADVIWLPLDVPASHAGRLPGGDGSSAVADDAAMVSALRNLSAKIADDAPIWANLPARDVLPRFLCLPPLPDAKLAKLLEQELAAQYPLPADQLFSESCVTGCGPDGSPRAVLTASKKSTLEQRVRLFAEAGLKITAIQSDPVALHQFASYEWADQMNQANDRPATQSAIAVLDCGATGTTCYVATATGFWFRHFSFGGNDLTAKLAAACDLTRQQAETLRKQPAHLTPLSTGMVAIEQRVAGFALQFGQTLPLATAALGELQLQRIFCTGGTALQHGWCRHAIAADLLRI